MEEIITDDRLRARDLYFEGYRVGEIARKLELKAPTVHSWKKRDAWDDTPVIQRVESSIDKALCRVLAKEEKTDRDFKEIDTLTRALMRTSRIKRFENGGNETDLNPKLKNRNRGTKKKPRKNYLDEQQCEDLKTKFFGSLFDYQKTWYEAGILHDVRNILKSRQIGATWYFAREALIDAIETGRNQVFLSASKAQAHVFKLYILQFVQEVTGVEFKGDPITLWNGATLYFLGTNARTAQSYHGNVYMDEYFWIPRFKQFQEVSSGMAMHEKWRETYFSTPSALTHEAYPFWSGKHFNEGRAKAEYIDIDISHKALKDGQLCEDDQWRQIVNIEDAVQGGCDLFNLEKLRRKYSEDAFNNLLMCQFIDDAISIFSLSALSLCMVDTWEVWDDFKPFSPRPFGDRPVWLGYDPSRTRDDAAVIVIAPPAVPGGKFRILEKITYKNLGFDKQAAAIEKLTEKYNVQHIGIDVTGIGAGVIDFVREFYPGATGIHYNPEVKGRMVLKAQTVINNGRLEFDAGDNDICAAFLSIRKTVTPSGQKITYDAVRTNETGHGDTAWATMHALDHEPLTGGSGKNKSFVEFC